jgi:CRISPR-associated Csx14 family protein
VANILLSAIGRSPGAVTGLYYALQEQAPSVPIDTVVLMTTAMPEIRDSAKLVLKTLGKDKVHLLRLRAQNRKVYTPDFDNQDAMLDFIMQVNAVLAHARRAKNQVFLGVSGGRSSMGALLTLSAYVYGAAGVYHLWVEKWFEDHGDIYAPEVTETLYPPKDQRRLIGLPLASFDQFWNEGQLGQVLAERPDARKALLRAVTDVEMQEFKKLQELQKQWATSFEEVSKQLLRIFKNTEMERSVEAAIQIYGLREQKDVNLAKVVELAEQLKPHFPPSFWKQVKQDLSDWETWKGGADRLLKFVETVAAPLTIGGLAALWSIPLK